MPLLGEYDVRAIDRRDGIDLLDREQLRRAIAGCEIVIHLAAIHPLVAPPGADERMYREANIVPFEVLLAEAEAAGVRRVVLASSTSVWRDSPIGTPARFLDETVPPRPGGPVRALEEGRRGAARAGAA